MTVRGGARLVAGEDEGVGGLVEEADAARRAEHQHRVRQDRRRAQVQKPAHLPARGYPSARLSAPPPHPIHSLRPQPRCTPPIPGGR